MITSLKISNYKSLGEKTNIKFSRFTTLVGQNGSGKSNIIDVPRFIADIMRQGLEGAITKRHGIKALRRWSGGKPLDMSIEIKILSDSFQGSYSFDITSHSKHEYRVKSEHCLVTIGKEIHQFLVNHQTWQIPPPGGIPKLSPMSLALPIVSGDERFKPLASFLSNMAVYNIYPDTLRSPKKYDPSKPIDEHGENWLSVLRDQDIDTWKPEMVTALGKLTNEVDDMLIKQLSGFLISTFRHGTGGIKGKWFDASQESDGTLRVAGIIAALIQRPYVPVIGIEEPELTVHPGAIPLIHDFIQEAANRSQVILTTHSPELLELVNPEDVRVVEKIGGITRVSVISPEQKDAVKRGLMTLGEIHRTEGIQSAQTELELDGPAEA
jgi:predicted ATPase